MKKTYISKPMPSVKRFDAGALTGFPGAPPSAKQIKVRFTVFTVFTVQESKVRDLEQWLVF